MLSQLTPALDLKLCLPVPSYLRDHRFQGRAVFPAVEAMQALARCARDHFPSLESTAIVDAAFERFLIIPDDATAIDTLVDLAPQAGGGVQACLKTRITAAKSGISREITHVRLAFGLKSEPATLPPLDVLAALEGACLALPAQTLYAEMVPFGPAYHNLTGEVRLSPFGAAGWIRPVDFGLADGPLGAVFVLDAAFHAACVWGQVYGGFVGFPVGIGRREIFSPCIWDQAYFCRVFPKTTAPAELVCDICIFDDTGQIREMAWDVRMADVSRGKMRPPENLKAPAGDALKRLAAACDQTVVIELAGLMPFAGQTLGGRELKRFSQLGRRRQSSYLAARLCCKRLYRHLTRDMLTSPQTIITTCEDLIRPCCPPLPDGTCYHCSVSHDRRFAVAVAAKSPVGVDVEAISEKALRGRRFFILPEEEALIHRSFLPEIEAAMRIWTLKEAAAKALGLELPRAWKNVRIVHLDSEQSRFTAGKAPITAVHANIDAHVFSLVKVPRTISGDG